MPLPPQKGYVGLNGTATAQTSMPAATYRATMPPSMFNNLVGTNVTGYIEGVGSSAGVRFTVNLQNLPSQPQYGPFNWHIHTLPVPANGNCTATMGHLDPTNRGELIMCDASAPETCQAGDLAGKHGGKIMTPNTFTTSFVEPYLTTAQGSPFSFAGLSFVLHSSNTTRLTCANFVRRVETEPCRLVVLAHQLVNSLVLLARSVLVLVRWLLPSLLRFCRVLAM
jgi:Cu/Zn superoxide dismutase